MHTKPYLIGITGGSGSGKTHFLRQLMGSLPPQQVCLVSQDMYYRPANEQQMDAQGVLNFDEPESIDHKQFEADLLDLIQAAAWNATSILSTTPK
jgi:uridine kinase